ncbi:ABC transporter permease [Methanosarcina sp. 2.H.T.1A.6]|uniref:ABC transporter permease n=1 Tax=unclassified Methanosarcina TaxID=2644672 RepID=UPI000621C688|nr:MULTISPECIES: ABC transporter permease [unclassified Methanosarcina]KKG18511.1 ABC transporter permease [Methanosarcina sp. 2.H.T.1A.3]KKG21166.1 ABC transporter permease [Methanosarcina sp. 2.H.T.1A.8]KKG22216.1 ABC transporter permease [Methanosarcina sp. 2.H.T.1A.15]KKG22320.1 ABC transporter permease [Methanosarcina sp. 2.H.T.1A.6]
MKADVKNIEVIAQKEFADRLYSPSFKMLLGIFTLILLSMSIEYGINGYNIFEFGFLDIAQVITLFIPILGLALGFDSVVREKNSKSLNTLLTHPVFRDNIISGKIIGGLGALIFVVFISVIASIGILLILTGIDVGFSELNRILIFSLLTFLYLSGFFAFSLLMSIISKSSESSFISGLIVWINLVLIFGAIVTAASSIITGELIVDLGHNEEAMSMSEDLQKLSPASYYAEAVTGVRVSYGSFGISSGKDTNGIFDTRFGIGTWLADYWTNLVVLTAIPVLIFILSYMVFLRRDIGGEKG